MSVWRMDSYLESAPVVAREGMLAVLLFLASLSSWYFYEIGATVPPLLSYVLMLAAVCWVVRREGMRQLDVLAALVLLLALGAATLAQLVAAELPFSWSRTLGVLTCATTLPIATVLLRSSYFSGISVRRVLGWVIGVHVGAIGIQLAYFVVTHQYLDFLFDITGEWQRVYGSKGLNIGVVRLPRFAGLFNEPGTYSGAMLPLFFVYRLLRGKADWLYGAALFSVVLTMSAFGMVGVLLCVFYEALTGMSRKTLSVSLLVVALATVAVALVLVPAYESRFSGDRVGSLSLRVSGLAAFSSLDYRALLFGRGPATDAGGCPDCIGLYMGTGITWIYYFGFLNFVVFFLVASLIPYLRHIGVKALFSFLFFLLIVSAMKIKYVYPWLGWLLALGAFVCMTPGLPRQADAGRQQSRLRVAKQPFEAPVVRGDVLISARNAMTFLVGGPGRTSGNARRDR